MCSYNVLVGVPKCRLRVNSASPPSSPFREFPRSHTPAPYESTPLETTLAIVLVFLHLPAEYLPSTCMHTRVTWRWDVGLRLVLGFVVVY
jgi:hypothetical protein